MSHVTSVVLLTSEREEDGTEVPSPGVAALQSWLREADLGQLARLDNLFGGWKHPQFACCGADLNHPGVGGLVARFRALDWRYPDQMVLALTTEAEIAFGVRSRMP